MADQEETKEPKEMRSIGKAMMSLSSAQGKLSSMIESLEKDLEPITSHTEDTPSEKPERPSMNCKLAEEIECAANRAEGLNHKLASLRNRLEL